MAPVLLVPALIVGALLVAAFIVFRLFFRYIPNDRAGVVEKRWSLGGSIPSGLIALNGEAGFTPKLLRGGFHFLNVFQYRIHIVPLVTIPQGRIGYVFARDGRPLDSTQTLASNVQASDFQDVEAFLRRGGQKGPQRKILREGTYAIHLGQFSVITQDKVYILPLDKQEDAVFRRMADIIAERGGFTPVIIRGSDDAVGVVTVHDGASLPQGEIIAPTVGDDPTQAATYHSSFQDPERFLAAGGKRGRQLQVLVEGTYYINRLFATVELIHKTVIEVGHVGVVISYTGGTSDDLSGNDYTHGELVARGCRGVWNEALLPGKYAFNTYAGKVVVVPTTNIILKWVRSEIGSHHFDENLAEVSLITKDAFEPSLPLSVVVHIDYKKAPLVIQRFGDIRRLVEQTLDPMVSAYFKNIGQTRTLIQLIQDRAEIQRQSGLEMQAKFARYNLDLEEVLIGTPTSSEGDRHIETILAQLRARQIAEEQVETYERQQRASVKERELREAEARATQQHRLTESELSIVVETNQGKAEYQRSLQQAAQMRALAEAEADRMRTLAEANAERAARVGIAEAVAIEEQVRAYGGPRFQLTHQVMTRLAEAIETAKVDLVPRVVVGTQNGQIPNVLEGLLASLMAPSPDDAPSPVTQAVSALRPEVEKLRDEVRSSMTRKGARPPTAQALGRNET